MITGTMPILTVNWTDVTSGVTTFLGSALVVGAIAAVLALRFLPRFMRAVRAIVRW